MCPSSIRYPSRHFLSTRNKSYANGLIASRSTGSDRPICRRIWARCLIVSYRQLSRLPKESTSLLPPRYSFKDVRRLLFCSCLCYLWSEGRPFRGRAVGRRADVRVGVRSLRRVRRTTHRFVSTVNSGAIFTLCKGVKTNGAAFIGTLYRRLKMSSIVASPAFTVMGRCHSSRGKRLVCRFSFCQVGGLDRMCSVKCRSCFCDNTLYFVR